MKDSIPILMYHLVSPRPPAAFRKYAVTPGAFAAQMIWLKLAGYTTITFDMMLDCRAGRCSLPRRPIIITFDDGFQDCADYAVPILQDHGFTAVFFLVAKMVGTTSHWLLAERGVEFPLMNWAVVRRLETAGFTCGAHTMSHPRLAELPQAICRDELQGARRLLEDQLGHEVRHMAYPFGSFNEYVRAVAVDLGYHLACSTRIGLSNADDDLLALHRVPIIGHDTLLDFICRLRTAWSLGDVLHSKAAGVSRRLRGKEAHILL